MNYVKCNSHRAREKLAQLLGYKPKSFYNLAVSYHLYEVPADRLTEALQIKGVVRGKMKSIVDSDGYEFAFRPTWSTL